MTLDNRSGSDALWTPFHADAHCPGRIIDGTPEQVWAQTMENETVGRDWGNPPGLNRSPTFSGYGWNRDVAGQLSLLPDGDLHPIPALVIQGLEDGVLPTGPGTGKVLYDALYKDLPPASRPNKVLVEVECASHVLQWEGCAPGCTTPHATFRKALIEWIKSGTFNGEANGPFKVDQSGMVSRA